MSAEEQKQRHDEDEQQRRNREVIELLNELRVALPGVQVLFAFLLIVPFSQGFSSVTSQQQYVYFATLLCTGVAAAVSAVGLGAVFVWYWYGQPLLSLRK